MLVFNETLQRAIASIEEAEVALTCSRGQTVETDPDTGLVTKVIKTCTADDEDEACDSCIRAWELEEMRVNLNFMMV